MNGREMLEMKKKIKTQIETSLRAAASGAAPDPNQVKSLVQENLRAMRPIIDEDERTPARKGAVNSFKKDLNSMRRGSPDSDAGTLFEDFGFNARPTTP